MDKKVPTSAIAKSTSEQTQITSSNATIYYKIFLNNVAMVYIGDPKNLPTNAKTQLATLPSSIVPKNIVYHDAQNLSDNKVIRFIIHTDGKLYAYNYSGTVGTSPANIGINIVYLV